jgi:hypothetical protein
LGGPATDDGAVFGGGVRFCFSIGTMIDLLLLKWKSRRIAYLYDSFQMFVGVGQVDRLLRCGNRFAAQRKALVYDKLDREKIHRRES